MSVSELHHVDDIRLENLESPARRSPGALFFLVANPHGLEKNGVGALVNEKTDSLWASTRVSAYRYRSKREALLLRFLLCPIAASSPGSASRPAATKDTKLFVCLFVCLFRF